MRVESGVEPGSVISPYYDSMIAKVIRVDVDRGATLDALQLDLEDIDVLGVKTNLAFLHALLNDDDVVNGDLWTGLIAERLPQLVSSQVSPTAIAAGARALLESERLAHVPDTVAEPWSQDDGFQLGGLRQISRAVLANGQSHDVTMTWQQGLISFRVDGEQAGTARAELDSDEFVTPEHELGPLVEVEDGCAYVFHDLDHVIVRWPIYDANAIDEGDAGDAVRAPINGRVAKLFVDEGDPVAEGDSIAVVEAMKMEHVLASPRAGTIDRIHVGLDAQVVTGAVIASLAMEETG
ncbi:MAG: biotin/lipoyl-containing protein [Hyphomicrobiaceae bacterium]